MDFRDIKEFLKDASKYIITIIIVLVVVLYVVSLQQIIGPSMQNTLNDNDVVIIDKLSYVFTEPKRNDIISFEYAETKYLVKRIIGLPGEKVEYKKGILYINGESYQEKSDRNKETIDFDLSILGFDTIPEDMYLVLGDNRTNSLDSRSKKVGLIKKENIIGKAIIKIWPITEFKVIK